MTEVCDFFLHLFQDETLAPSSIDGYRSAIHSVWGAVGRSLTDSYHVSRLLRSFRVERPRSCFTFPRWDLNLVLRVLARPPFSPVDPTKPLWRSAKTVFLLLLASARRRGDIHAIDPRRITFTRTGAILEPFPGYLPKIRSTAEGESRYQPIVIRSLSAITDDPGELALCPVRALRSYHSWAGKRSPNRKRFFLSLRQGGQPVAKATISAWVVKLLKLAYSHASTEDARLASTSVHEIRALAASIALQSTFALSDVLRAAAWATPCVFAAYYLRDVSGLRDGLHVLSPCVVAGSTVH